MTDWTAVPEAPAIRALASLPPKAAWAVTEFITGPLERNPYRATKFLDEPFEGIRSGNVGVYRVLVRIIDEENIVRIMRVEHRSTVYSRPL